MHDIKIMATAQLSVTRSVTRADHDVAQATNLVRSTIHLYVVVKDKDI